MNLKNAALSVLHHSGALGLARYGRRHGLVVMTYHGVLPGDDDRDDYLLGNFIASSAFDVQMAWISRRYAPVTMTQVVRAFTGGPPLPPRAIAVTFDDGFANNFRYAHPILRRHGVPATVFLTTGHIGVRGAQLWTERVKRAIYLSSATRLAVVVPGQPDGLPMESPPQRADAARRVLGLLKRLPPVRRDAHLQEIEEHLGRPPLGPADADRYDFLSWREVREMAADGVEFGSHTVSHPILSTVSDDELRQELQQSKAAIEGQLDRECPAFAYPNGGDGDFGAREKAALKACGYQVAFSQSGGVNRRDADPFDVRRVNISRGFRPALLEASLSGALRWGQEARARVASVAAGRTRTSSGGGAV